MAILDFSTVVLDSPINFIIKEKTMNQGKNAFYAQSGGVTAVSTLQPVV